MNETIRFKDLFEVISQKNTDPNVILLAATQNRGIIPKSEVGYRTVTISEENFEGLKLVKKGDFCITLRSFQGGIEYSEYDGGISSGYTVLRFKRKAFDKYFKYFLKNIHFISTLNKYKISIRDGQNIPFSNLGKESILFLPYNQQTAIANYLDYHTTKLDKEISLLEKKVEKLDEYKQALIYETVTKGLDKNVPMKDSCIEWIGMIPEHWEVKRVKDFSQCYAGGTPETNKDEYWESGTNYWAASGNLKNGLINLDILKKITDLATKNSSTKKINPFTTLIAMTGATCGEVGYSDTTIYANQSVCAIKNKKRNSNYKYIFYYFLSARKDVESLKLGGAQAGINGDDVKHIKIVFPNILEQQQIIEYLDEQCSKIDKKKELINKKVELLKEYKQSLIYEAVTGKLK